MVLTLQCRLHRDARPQLVLLTLRQPVCRVDVLQCGPPGLLLDGDDGLAGRPPGGPVLDAARLVEGGRRTPTEAVSGLRVRTKCQPGAQGRLEGATQGRVDALELVSHRDLERFEVVDPCVRVREGCLDRTVEPASVGARPGLHDVTDEDDRRALNFAHIKIIPSSRRSSALCFTPAG